MRAVGAAILDTLVMAGILGMAWALLVLGHGYGLS